MIGFSMIHYLFQTLQLRKKIMALFGTYVVIYVITVLVFHILIDNPFFHLEYLLFVMLGVIIGGLLIESYVKLYRLNNRLTDMV